jgi:hypothetical protein
MKHYLLFVAVVIAWVSDVCCHAQQLSAPGWNRENARPGEVLFKHESGKGMVKISVIPSPGEQYLSELLTKSLAGVGAPEKCPALKSARVVKIMDGTASQARSSDGATICSISLKSLDAKRAYMIIVIDMQAGAAGAERLADSLMKGLSGGTSASSEPTRVVQKSVRVSAAALPPANSIVAVFFDMTRSQINMVPLANGGFAQQTDFFNDSEVLFAGGVACRDCLEDWVKDTALRKYRKENPNDMGRWIKVSGGYSVKYPDDKSPRLLKNQDVVAPAPAGKRFNNMRLESVQGRSIGSGESYLGIVQTDDIFLGADGSFVWASENETFRPTMITEVMNSKSPSQVGRYTVSGYAMKLEYRSGKSEIISLLHFPNDPGFLVIDGESFTNTKFK